MSTAILSPIQNSKQQQTHFYLRLVARLVVIFISLSLIGQRLTIVYADQNMNPTSAYTLTITLPFLGALSLIVLVEFLLYKKLGHSMIKYAKFADIFFILVFTADWILMLKSQFGQPAEPDSKCYSLFAVVSFTSFSWRTSLQILITPKWQLRSISPICAYAYTMWYVVNHDPDDILLILLRGILQVLYVVIIFYLENKISFKIMMGSMQQEQWLQVNEFILNNIPENIAILDLNGNCNFINDYFKKMMTLRNHSSDIKQFFKGFRDIQQQHLENDNEPSESYIMEMAPIKRYFSSSETKGNAENFEAEALTSLEDIIAHFCELVKKGALQERSFQIFQGNFNYEEGIQERSFEIKISFINHNPKKYIVLILKDTTQRDLILTLEGNIKYKDYLLASVSHELRTPLNGNINLVEAAIKSPDVCEQIKEGFLIPAVKSSKFLLHLINDILDMSQIKAQKLRLVFQKANLQETLSNTVKLLELQAQRKGICLEANIGVFLPTLFCTDHVRLGQILINLLNFSVKSAQQGKIILSAYAKDTDDCIQIDIETPGVEISEKQATGLFQDFTQIGFKNQEGLTKACDGLGLKIAYDLSKLLAPKSQTGILVEPKPLKFSFLLENKESGLESQIRLDDRGELSPLVAKEFDVMFEPSLQDKIPQNLYKKSLAELNEIRISTITTDYPYQCSSSCSCPKILVVDDDPFNIMAYEVILNSLNLKYECAFNGKNAIDKMLSKVRYPCSTNCYPYKVVFMDEEMPVMTGKQTVAEIKNLQTQNLLPFMNIVGCTAHHDGEEIAKFVNCGIREYLRKPISKEIIKRTVEKYDF